MSGDGPTHEPVDPPVVFIAVGDQRTVLTMSFGHVPMAVRMGAGPVGTVL